MSDDRVRLRIHGQPTLEQMAELLGHWNGLMEALTESVTGDPKSVRWDLVGLRFECDGCGAIRPDEHDDWTYRDGDDLCPACTALSPTTGDL